MNNGENMFDYNMLVNLSVLLLLIGLLRYINGKLRFDILILLFVLLCIILLKLGIFILLFYLYCYPYVYTNTG